MGGWGRQGRAGARDGPGWAGLGRVGLGWVESGWAGSQAGTEAHNTHGH
jgi:hypothetical protein